MASRYIVFDTETPNSRNNRMSAIGISVVEDGVITREFATLVNPEAHFDPFNIQLTGITPEAVEAAPTFPALWQELEPLFDSGMLVAHNAPFDEGCLKAVFQMYQMEYPGYEFHCTCRASRRKLGTLLPNHQLQTVAAYCGYDLTQHHNALADAEACAWIARELL